MADLVPADLEEMFRAYAGYVRGLVVQLGIPSQEAEDAAADIMARLYERDLIGMYDPDHKIEHGGVVMPARFKSFLSHQVALYVRGKRDAIQRRSRRELQILDMSEGGIPLIELVGGTTEDDYSSCDADEFIAKARGYLAVVPRRSTVDRCDLVELFDEMVKEVRENGEFTYASLQLRFGISSTSAAAWVGRLRECLHDAASYLSACHVVYGVILTDADIMAAIKLLKEAGGSHVMPYPLGQHKLGGAKPPGWFKEFAAQERKLYPELAADVGKPDKRRPGVKLAVIHRLERMLPVIEPEVDSPTWDLVEAELWRSGADSGSVARIFGLVQQAIESGEAVPAWL